MGGSHGGSGDGVGGGLAADPCGLHVNTWGKDIKDSAVVGETSAVVRYISGTDGDGVWCRGGRVVGGISIVVTGSDDDGDTGGDGRGDSRVDSSGVRATERHGEDSLATLARGVSADELDTADDAGVGSGSIAIEDLDSD